MTDKPPGLVELPFLQPPATALAPPDDDDVGRGKLWNLSTIFSLIPPCYSSNKGELRCVACWSDSGPELIWKHLVVLVVVVMSCRYLTSKHLHTFFPIPVLDHPARTSISNSRSSGLIAPFSSHHHPIKADNSQKGNSLPPPPLRLIFDQASSQPLV